MKPKLIVMLTCNDHTVENAVEIFEDCIDLPVDNWGFKNVGISETKMCELLTVIKAAGKKTFFEVVTYTEESCMNGAKFACEQKFDFLLGTCFYQRVWDYLKYQSIQYYPFIGNVANIPSELAGSFEDMVNEADELYAKNVSGVDILAYRYIDGNQEKLARGIVKRIKQNAIIAGDINSIERLKTVNNINPWGFTMGSALFTQKFVSNAGFRANLEKVLEFMDLFNELPKYQN